jgi:hypothetical protein
MMLMMMILLMMMMLLMMMKGHIEGELYPLYTQFPPNLDSHRQSLGWGRVVRIAVVGIRIVVVKIKIVVVSMLDDGFLVGTRQPSLLDIQRLLKKIRGIRKQPCCASYGSTMVDTRLQTAALQESTACRCASASPT